MVVTGLGDYGAYLRRIGLSRRPDWMAVHRAHATTVPFENLDPVGGRPVSLALADLEAKLVASRRGGYCFEHNLLLAAGLASAGIADVDLMLARVRYGQAAGVQRPLTHLLLRVTVNGSAWHADVGFGGDGLLDPIPFGPGVQSTQDGWVYRTVTDGNEVVLQMQRDGQWVDLYGFEPDPAPLVDLEVANWYTSTHPRSPFVNNVIVSAQRTGQRLGLIAPAGSDGQLVRRSPGTAPQASSVARADLASVLADEFGLTGAPIPA